MMPITLSRAWEEWKLYRNPEHNFSDHFVIMLTLLAFSLEHQLHKGGDCTQVFLIVSTFVRSSVISSLFDLGCLHHQLA